MKEGLSENSLNWDRKIEVIKGNIAEDLCREIVEKRGWVLYTPKTPKAHILDGIMVQKKPMRFMGIEAKCKGRRTRRWDTGINKRHRDEYLELSIQHKIEIVLMFVDETPLIESVYGNSLSILESKFKADCIGGIQYYSLEGMLHFGKIPPGKAKKLRELSTTARKYPYWGLHDDFCGLTSLSKKQKVIYNRLTGAGNQVLESQKS